QRSISIERLADWMSAAPARLVGIGARKGRIAPGLDADFVVLDPDAEETVEAARLFHRHALSPYLGRTLPGVVRRTYLRGMVVFEDGRVIGEPRGVLLAGPSGDI